MKRVLSLILTFTFLINNISYGLGITPGSNVSAVRDDMRATGRKLFNSEGPGGKGNLDFSSLHKEFIGEPEAPEGVEFLAADGSYFSKGQNYNRLLSDNVLFENTNLIDALKYFRDEYADLKGLGYDIKEGYFDVDEAEGELPIARIEKGKNDKYTLIIHTKFVQMWNGLRKNDILFRANVGENMQEPQERVVSVAWGIFFRLAKHEMEDIGRHGTSKSKGHLSAYVTGMLKKKAKINASEDEANKIGGRYNIVNDAIWMWFLGAYCFGDTTRYNDEMFSERVKWFFEEGGKKIELDKEFQNLIGNGENKEFAIQLARVINHAYYSREDLKPYELTVDQKHKDEFQSRKSSINGKPLYATGGGRDETASPTISDPKDEGTLADLYHDLTLEGKPIGITPDVVMAQVKQLTREYRKQMDLNSVVPRFKKFLESTLGVNNLQEENRKILETALKLLNAHGLDESELKTVEFCSKFSQDILSKFGQGVSDHKKYVRRQEELARGILLSSGIIDQLAIPDLDYYVHVRSYHEEHALLAPFFRAFLVLSSVTYKRNSPEQIKQALNLFEAIAEGGELESLRLIEKYVAGTGKIEDVLATKIIDAGIEDVEGVLAMDKPGNLPVLRILPRSVDVINTEIQKRMKAHDVPSADIVLEVLQKLSPEEIKNMGGSAAEILLSTLGTMLDETKDFSPEAREIMVANALSVYADQLEETLLFREMPNRTIGGSVGPRPGYNGIYVVPLEGTYEELANYCEIQMAHFEQISSFGEVEKNSLMDETWKSLLFLQDIIKGLQDASQKAKGGERMVRLDDELGQSIYHNLIRKKELGNKLPVIGEIAYINFAIGQVFMYMANGTPAEMTWLAEDGTIVYGGIRHAYEISSPEVISNDDWRAMLKNKNIPKERVFPRSGDVEPNLGILQAQVKDIVTGEIKNMITEARILLAESGTMEAVEEKIDGDSATETDDAIGELLRKTLPEFLPGSIVVEEESFNEETFNLETIKNNRFVWVVDPIDGTKAFRTPGNNEYCVAVSLLDRGKPVLSVVYSPEYELGKHKGLLFEARDGLDGAYLNGERIHMNQGTDFENGECVTHIHRGEGRETVEKQIAEQFGEEETIKAYEGHSTLMHYCLAASGLLEGPQVFTRRMPNLWDIVQSAFIVEKAGGVVMYPNGESALPIDFDKLVAKGNKLLVPFNIACSVAAKDKILKSFDLSTVISEYIVNIEATKGPGVEGYKDSILSSLKDKIAEVVGVLIESGQVDVVPVIELARQIYPKFNPYIPEHRWASLPIEKFIVLSSALKYQIFIPNNLVFEISGMSGHLYVLDGKVDPEYWYQKDYLNAKIWINETLFFEGEDLVGGLSSGGLAMVNSDSFREAGKKEYKRIMGLKFDGPDRFAGPYEMVMTTIMQKAQVGEDDFVEGIVVESPRQEEIRHAQDHSYVIQKNKRDNRMDPDEEEQTVLELLKPSSTVHQIFAALEQEAQGNKEAAKANRQIGLRTTIEYSAHLGGIIAEMKKHKANNREDLAFIAFLKFMTDQLLSAMPQEIPHGDMFALARMNVAVILFQDIDEWAGTKLDYMSIDVIRMLGMEPGKLPVDKTLRMLEEIYAKHFWADDERYERLSGETFEVEDPVVVEHVIRKLDEEKQTRVWTAVKNMHATDIEIFVSQSTPKLTDAMDDRIIEINKKMKESGKSVAIKRYRDEDLIKDLNSGKKGAEKIIIADVESAEYIAGLLDDGANLKSFKNVRMLNVDFPEIEDEQKRTVCQADMLMKAILARLANNHNDEISTLLTEMLAGSFVGNKVNVNEFVRKITEINKDTPLDEIKGRAQYFLSGDRAISLIKKLEVELRALQEFWTYA